MLITRRALLAGTVLGPLSVDAHSADDPVALGHCLDETWTRCRVLETQVVAISEEAAQRCDMAGQASWDELQTMRTLLGYDQVWKPWSDTVAELEELLQRIIAAPAQSTRHLLIKHRALVIQFELADMGNPRFLENLQMFGRDLESLWAR